MNAITIIPLLILVIYVYKIQKWRYNWEVTSEFLPEKPIYTPISVIVAFRNERGNIENLLGSLKAQQYPAALFEVILVDDHSGDGSHELVKQAIGSDSNFRIISNSENAFGKKSALRTGILASSNDLIVTTDADATMHPKWLATISTFYQENHPDMVIGLADIKSGKTFFNRFSEAEFISLVASGSGAAASGHPIYCNGANLAYSKSVFQHLNDAMNEAVISGDDTFVLHSMKNSGKKIALLKSSQSVVTVKAPGNLKQFTEQHVRWVSKSKYYKNGDIIFTALIVFLINLSIVSALILLFSGANYWLFGFLMAVKALTDFHLIKSYYSYLAKKLPVSDYMVFSLMYPFFVVFIGIAGLFSGYSWKGRFYKTT
ncbi:MAG TPA: glycosyltransferase [Bacteroidales bacterium]|jgi:cellulose synthase/poly-beta-1,6-N-acetylglucosamine synthase-like glycosyltransferase|nr:glycosyltransferase [Bacteroidales bacterium]